MHGLERHNARKGSEDPERSGIRTRQYCGFFAPVFGRECADTRPRKGKEARRLRSVFTLPPTFVALSEDGFASVSQLTQEHAMTTTALVPVFAGTLAGQPAQLCNARDLHATLGVGRDFTNWIKGRIEEYGFTDGEDFCSPDLASKRRGRGGHNRTDYHLTLDMAKELAVVENNERGRQVRRYFIAVEKEARAKVGAGATAAKALPNKTALDAEMVSRINRHAWALAQATFERFRRELTYDIEHQWHRTAVEDWKPKEYREEFFEQLAANAMICHTFGDNIDRSAAKLAAMAGVDYVAVSAKFRPRRSTDESPRFHAMRGSGVQRGS